MALLMHTGVLPATRKPNTTPEASQEAEDWATKIAKAMEARRIGQKLRQGKQPVLSKTRSIKL